MLEEDAKAQSKVYSQRVCSTGKGTVITWRKFGGLVRQRPGRRSLSVMSLLPPLLCEVKELKGIKHRITSALSHVW